MAGRGKLGGVVQVPVVVQARAAHPGIRGIRGTELCIRTTAAPVNGAANRDVSRQLAREFGVPKSNIELVRGESSRHKMFRIREPRKRPDWIEALAAGCNTPR